MPTKIGPTTAKVAPASEEKIVGNAPVEDVGEDNRRRDSMIAVMREHFAGQPKEKIKIRKEDGEQFVQVNGYGFQIQSGVYVEVPQQVAEILRDADII